MRGARSGLANGRRWRDAMAILVAAWLFWLVLRTACFGVFVLRDPTVIEQLLPLPAFSLIQQAKSLPPGSAETRELYQRAVRIEPLAWQPYRYAAAGAIDDGRHADAVRLLEAARVRAPRREEISLALIGEYTRLRRYADAVRAADMTLRLTTNVAVARQLAPLLRAFTNDPAGRRAVAEALAREPRWRQFYTSADASIGADPQLVFDLLRRAAPTDSATRRRVEQSAFLNAMLDRGETDLAALAFLNFVPARFAERGAVYDDNFAGHPGPAPFNWTLRSLRGNAASIRFDDGNADGYLLVETAGRTAPSVAEQTLALQPGLYTLGVRLRGAEENGLSWTLLCRDRPERLAILPLQGSSGWQTTSVTFVVPASGCGAQKLRLLPGPAPSGGTVEIDWVRVAPVGAA